MNDAIKVELVYIASDKGFHGVTVNFLNEPYAVSILGKHSQERLVEIAVRGWLDNN